MAHRAFFCCCLIAVGTCANAQVVVDGRFGNAGALSGPNFKIPDTLGKTVGDNLFHSFNEFSLQTGQSATFTGPDSIQNILGRVTGNKVSEIDGLIQSEITDANLYLLNPSGFLFGKNAKVDVDGAFTVSTRESLKLGDEGSFNAVNPEQSVFTSAAPDAFGFLGENPGGAIKFSGSKLIVENPVGLVGGDIKLEDSVIYAKSEGKATGVRIEGNNLGIVDSQIRNKSTVEADGVKQGITIELKGDLEITDTTITEEDGSGVDRGDFIDEIGSDVPFASKVGLLGITEGFVNPDSIAIKAKDATITAGGVYSVNVVTEESVSRVSQSPEIDVNVESLHMNQGALDGTTKLTGLKHVQSVTLTRSKKTVKVEQTPFAKIGTVEIYLNGERMFEDTDFTLRFNRSGKLMPVSFTNNLPKGSTVDIVMLPANQTLPQRVSANVSGEMLLAGNSSINGGIVEMNVGSLSIEESQVRGNNSVNIQSETQLNLNSESSIQSDFIREGSVLLKSEDILLDGGSYLAGSELVRVEATGQVAVKGESTITVGWRDAPDHTNGRWWVFWDPSTGVVVREDGWTVPGKWRDPAAIRRRMVSIFGWWEDAYWVVDINNPHDYTVLPRVHISSGETLVENSTINTIEGANSTTWQRSNSALIIDSEDSILVMEGSTIDKFHITELNANTVDMSDVNVSRAFWGESMDYPDGDLIINSKGDTVLESVSLDGSLVIHSGENINIIDTNVEGYFAKLKADGNLAIGPSEGGALPHFRAIGVALTGHDIDVKARLQSDSDMIIKGLNKINIDGPSNISSNVAGVESLTIDAPTVYINEGVFLMAHTYDFLGVGGGVDINGSEVLKTEGITLEFSLPNYEVQTTGNMKLRGGDVILDNSIISHFSVYNYSSELGTKYGNQPIKVSGRLNTLIDASRSVEIVNGTSISVSNGKLNVSSKAIHVKDSVLKNNTVWPLGSSNLGEVQLIAEGDIFLENARLTAKSTSGAGRSRIELKGENLKTNNSLVNIFDERKGKSGSIDLDFSRSIVMDESNVISVGAAYLTEDTNGNDINVTTGELIMKDSVITGYVEGDGEKGVTRLDVSGDISMDHSFVGGLETPLELIEFDALLTDGTLGESQNLGNGDEVIITSGLGEVHGGNLYHSFSSLNLASGQTAVLEVPEAVSNVFVRITGGDETLLNGAITSDSTGKTITLINDKGFTLGPDVAFNTFSGVRLGALEQLKFKDGSTFGSKGTIEGALSGGEAVYDIQPEQLTGGIKLAGALLRDFADEGEKPSDVSLFGNVLDMSASSIATSGGADINLMAKDLTLSKASRIQSISPKKGEGGTIHILAGKMGLLESEVKASSTGGLGGNVNIDSPVFDLKHSTVEANSFYRRGSFGKYDTGDVNITAKESLTGFLSFLNTSSFGPGGAGDLSISAGDLVWSGKHDDAGVGFNVRAYSGKTGEMKIDADYFDSQEIVMSNTAWADQSERLSAEEKETYGDITINTRNANLRRLSISTGTEIYDFKSTLGDVVIQADNDIIIGGVQITNNWGYNDGAGSDVTISGRNILDGSGSSKQQAAIYKSIGVTGSVFFHAEEQLELSRMKFYDPLNSTGRDVKFEFKGKNIILGMNRDEADDAGVTSTVSLGYDHQGKNGRVLISAEENVRLLDGVDISIPAISVEAGSLDMNQSKLTLGGIRDSNFKVREGMTLSGSTIQSLSPVGRRNKRTDHAATLNISSGHLTLEAKSKIWTENATGTSSDNKPIANLKIQSGLISLDEAHVGSWTFNQSKAGDVEIEAEGLSLRDSAIGSLNHTEANAGDVNINTGHIVLAEESFIANGSNKAMLNLGWDPFAPGDAGDISINSDSLRLENGSFIRNAQIDTSLPGNVSITTGAISLAGGSFIATESVPLYQSDFSNRTEVDQNGSVNIKTVSLALSDSSFIKTTTVIPKRNAGNITIEANTVSLTGRSSMLSNTEPNKFETELGLTGLDYGNAGRLAINSHTVRLSDQSKISSDSFTSGDGGDVSITSSDLALAKRSAIYAGALGQGQGGRIAIDTTALNLSGKSTVVADVRDSGNGGEVTVKAATLEMDESLIYGSTSGAGAGSRISVEAESIALQNGARIESAASAGGAAGALDVQSGIVTIMGRGEGFDPKDIEGGETGETVASGLLTSTVGSGNAGTIELNADHLEMQQGLIGSASTGTGAAGSVGLRLAKGLSLGQGASVSVSSSQADGGDIEIESAGEVRLARSELTASAAKDGGSIRLLGVGHTYIRDSRLSAEAGQDGGNITISKPDLLFMNRGQLSANAVHGHGGYIQVSANTYLPSIDSLITASSEYGAQGVVEMDTVETDIGSGLVVLPDQLNSRSVNLAERCALSLKGDVSSFFLSGQGGLPVWSKENYLPEIRKSEDKR